MRSGKPIPAPVYSHVLGLDGLRERFPKNVETLSSGAFSRGDNYEKLHAKGKKRYKPGKIYSVRTNNFARLLTTTIQINGEFYQVILKDFPDHDATYKDSLLDPKYLADYLTKRMPEFIAQAEALKVLEQERENAIAALNTSSSSYTHPVQLETKPVEEDEEDEDEEDEEEVNFDAEGRIIPEEMQYFNRKLLELNQIQKKALKGKQPMVVNGMPGTGKSCVALAILIAALEKSLRKLNVAEDKEEKGTALRKNRILYVTASKDLRRSMKKMWKKAPEYNPEDPQAIEFKTYDELLQELVPETKDYTLADKNFFKEWLKKFFKENKNLADELRRYIPLDANLDDSLYQEFRVISGCKNYTSIGQSQSLFSIESQTSEGKLLRQKLMDGLETYRRHLRSHKHIDPAFYSFEKIPPLFSQIVIDEAQDLSSLQIAILKELAIKQQVSILLNNEQSLNDTLSKFPYIKQIFGNDLTPIELTESLRCSKQVVNIANVILDIEHEVTGGVVDTDLSSHMVASKSSQEGETYWVNGEPTEHVKKIMDQWMTSDECVVITLPQYVKEAQKEFPGAHVLTVEQAKGLEFKVVIAYRLFDDPRCHLINTKLNTEKDPEVEDSEEKSVKLNRPKKNNAHYEYGPDVHAWFTAATRAEHTLIIHNKVTRKIEKIYQRINNVIPKDIKNDNTHQVKEVTLDARLKQIKRDLKKGNEEAAEHLYFSHIADKNDLPKAKADFAALKKSVYDKMKKEEEDHQKELSIFLPPQPVSPASSSSSGKETTLRPITPKPEELKRILQYKSGPKFRRELEIFLKKYSLQCFLETTIDNEPILAHLDKDTFEILNEVVAKFNSFNKIDINYLTTTQVASLYGTTSLLYFLVSHPLGIKLLFNHFVNIKELTADHLREHKKSTSLLQLFSMWPLGCRMLLDLLQKKPDLANDFTIYDFKPLATKDMPGFEQCTSHLLSGTREGSALFLKLLELNPGLAQGFTSEDIFLVRKDVALYPNRSTFDNLASNSIDGARVLLKLFELNPAILANCTDKELAEALTVNLSFLVDFIDGREVIVALLNAHPTLAKHLKLSDLLHKTSHGTVLWELAMTLNSCPILPRLLYTNPEIIKGITAEELCQVYGPSSVMSILSGSDAGCQIILDLLNLENDLAKQLADKELISQEIQDALNKKDKGKLILEKIFLSKAKKKVSVADEKPELTRAGKFSKHVDSILGLPQTLFKPNLIKIFEKKPAPYLFETWIKNKSFIEHILANEFQLKALLEVLSNPNYLANLSIMDLSSKAFFTTEDGYITPFYYLASSPNGRLVLQKIFAHTEKFNITFLLNLFKTGSSERYQNTSLFYHLCSDEAGIAILSSLFKSNPSLNQITASDLMQIGYVNNVSAGMLLSRTPAGREFFHQLLQANKFIIKDFTDSFLLRIQSKENGVESVLSNLCLDAHGLQVLALMLENETFVEGLTIFPLTLALLSKDKDKNFPLKTLSESLLGLSIINKLLMSQTNEAMSSEFRDVLENDPDCKDILDKVDRTYPSRSLKKNVPEDKKQEKNKAPLPKNVKAELEKIFSQPNPVDVLFETVLENNSLLIEYIFKDPTHLKTFITFLRENQNAKAFTATNLTIKRLPDINGSPSILHFLTKNNEGCMVLKALLDNNSDIINHLKMTDFTQTGNSSDKININVLYHLAQRPIGLMILTQLLEKHKTFASTLKGTDLTRAVGDESFQRKNTSAAYWLSSSAAGCKVFLKMLEQNSSIAKDFTANDLLASTENQSFMLYNLSINPNGHEVLLKLFQEHPSLLTAFEPLTLTNALCYMPDNDFTLEHSFPLDNLRKNPKGMQALCLLLKANPETVKELNTNPSWCWILREIFKDSPTQLSTDTTLSDKPQILFASQTPSNNDRVFANDLSAGNADTKVEKVSLAN